VTTTVVDAGTEPDVEVTAEGDVPGVVTTADGVDAEGTCT